MEDIEQYAIVKDGDVDDNAVNISYDTAFEIAKGDESKIYSMADKNRPDVFDEDIHGAPEFEYQYDSDEDKVIRTWNFSYHNDVKENARKKVDIKVDLYFLHKLEMNTYKLDEYTASRKAAEQFLELSEQEQEDASEEDWPILAAGVCRDTKLDSDDLCESLYDVAEVIVDRAKKLDTRLKDLRDERKSVKFKIENCDPEEDKEKIAELYQDFLSDMNQLAANRKVT